MSPDNRPPCDTCGKPATHITAEILRHEVPGAVYVQYSATGIKHYGCDKHPPQEVEHVTHLPPKERV